MSEISLIQLAVLLAAAAIVAPLAKHFKVGAVLGYLFAGVLIGPQVLEVFTEVGNILHIAEFGVVLLLFLIGLELKPQRLWAMRKSVFGVGGIQVAASAVVLTGVMIAADYGWRVALFTGLALSLSSTAMVLQVLKETGELEQRHGRLGFGVLLFQDLAAIPMIALVGLLATRTDDIQPMSLTAAVQALGAIAFIALAGRYLLSWAFHLIARTAVSEAMTAFALLTVVVIEVIMKGVGLSPALGAFIAGALLADSAYRHEIEADIKPFEGLLLGLFFIAIGMSLDLSLLVSRPVTIAVAVCLLIAIKALIIFALARHNGLRTAQARRVGLALSQGGEFAFVLSAAAVTSGVIFPSMASLINVIVTVTMVLTPLLLLAERALMPAPARPAAADIPDDMPEHEQHVVIAGLGRFGQIIARVLAARKIPFTALDGDASQIEVVRRFGGRVYFGDASRLDILEAAQIARARAVVVCISNVEASIRTVELIRRNYPDLPIYARARDRNHVHRLMDHGVEHIMRETFLSALEMSRKVLIEAGLSRNDAAHTIRTFAERDRQRLYDDYAHASDQAKMAESAKRHAQELADLFETDSEGERS